MTGRKERRRTFRLKEALLIKYQVIDEEEFAAGIDRWRLRNRESSGLRSKVIDLNARLDESFYRLGCDLPAVSETLKLLNNKLDIVIESLPEFRQSKQDLACQAAQNCELGSSGLRFALDEALPAQTKLLLQFMVLPDDRFFESFAEVTRTEELDDVTMGQYSHVTATMFHGMGTAEHEYLIQHLFTKQSETLRQRRKQNERET